MSAFDKYPLGKPAFVTHSLDRAAHLRTNDEKLFAMEGQSNARAYVVYRDSLVMKQEENGPRALLSIKEALDYGANPGTIFLGLRDGAPIFGMGMSPAAAEKLAGRKDVLMLVPIVLLVLPSVVIVAAFPGIAALRLVVP